jgi:hypothetical protein
MVILYLSGHSTLSHTLGGNHFSSGSLEKFALASSAFNRSLGGLGKRMSLDGDGLGGEVFSSNNDLVDGVLGLGDGIGLQQRVDYLNK